MVMTFGQVKQSKVSKGSRIKTVLARLIESSASQILNLKIKATMTSK